MTPLDEAPEQRWRRTVDRRNRPAKLKVERLLRDFGYPQLDSDVGDAIEARLAGVALAVAPSLRDVAADAVVTIYANDSAAAPEETAPEPDVGTLARAPADEPAAAADIAQMVSYLKQQVIDARAEAERLRTELDRRIAARIDSEREAEATIAEQAAALQEQRRQVAELAAALASTREALAETRDEIRRAVGELQALPEPEAVTPESSAPADADGLSLVPESIALADEPGDDELNLSGEEWADGREEAAPAVETLESEADDFSAQDADELAAPGPIAAGEPRLDLEEPAVSGHELGPGRGDAEAAHEARASREPELDLEEASALELEEPALRTQEPGLDLEEEEEEEASALELEETARRTPASDLERKPAFELVEPALVTQEGGLDPEDRSLELDEPAVRASEPSFDLEEPAHDGEAPVPDEQPAPVPDVEPPALSEVGAPPPQTNEWLPAALRSSADDAPPAPAEPSPAAGSERDAGRDELTDFDEFLYDADELYDPAEAPAGDAPGEVEVEIEARWPDPDQAAGALPPPPPPPPSPWADELAPEAPVVERATLGKALRSRTGRSRGRWHGSCSICGREPFENRRKDLEAAGWNLDDDAAACPQCRGVG